MLPEFTRFAWTSDGARSLWEPRFARIRKAWAHIEWLSVRDEIRSCAVTRLDPEQLVLQTAEWAAQGLSALPVGLEASGKGPYCNAVAKPGPHEPIVFRVAVGTLKNLAALKHGLDTHDDETVGRLLGYPSCCRRFFRAAWFRRGVRDSSWPMALGTAGRAVRADLVEVEGSDLANVLWRWSGIRAVPHLPCAFDCEPTTRLGAELMNAGARAGYDDEVRWIGDVLSWPVEWSALHGIAEIKTPILKTSTRTDVTARKRTIRRHGSGYPAEGAQGLVFPYRKRVVRKAASEPKNLDIS
jgi:hypothetical protein